MENLKEIGEKIKRFRKKAGLTQQELAKKVGVSGNFISLIEGGKKKCSPQLLEKIYKVLSIFPQNIPTYSIFASNFLLKSEEEVNFLYEILPFLIIHSRCFIMDYKASITDIKEKLKSDVRFLQSFLKSVTIQRLTNREGLVITLSPQPLFFKSLFYFPFPSDEIPTGLNNQSLKGKDLDRKGLTVLLQEYTGYSFVEDHLCSCASEGNFYQLYCDFYYRRWWILKNEYEIPFTEKNTNSIMRPDLPFLKIYETFLQNDLIFQSFIKDSFQAIFKKLIKPKVAVNTQVLQILSEEIKKVEQILKQNIDKRKILSIVDLYTMAKDFHYIRYFPWITIILQHRVLSRRHKVLFLTDIFPEILALYPTYEWLGDLITCLPPALSAKFKNIKDAITFTIYDNFHTKLLFFVRIYMYENQIKYELSD